VGDNYLKFGTFLLNDKVGNRVDVIMADCQGKRETIYHEILKEWLNGRGTEISWDSLVATLRKCDNNYLADQIEMARKQL
jgi:hypothetical protein